jgi:hypothetical protein
MGSDDKLLPLSSTLLDIIRNNDTPEICREKSAELLERMLSLGLSDENESQELHDFSWKCLKQICPVFNQRFSPRSCGGDYLALELDTQKPMENAEEIRLILVRIMGKIMANVQKESIALNNNITELITAFCLTLSKRALPDPYPDLKRESCLLLRSLALTFPNVIRENVEEVLFPILGPSFSSNDNVKEGEPSISNNASLVALLRHRHAKTRRLAIESVVDIVSCLPLNLGNEEDKANTLQRTLTTHVIPNFEAVSHDTSMAVRAALTQSISTILTLLLTEISANADDLNKQKEDVKSKEQVISSESRVCFGRLLVLLTMGILDDAEVVQSTSRISLEKISQLWVRIKQADRLEDSNLEDNIAILLRYFIVDLCTILLSTSSTSFSIERRARSLETLSLCIRMSKLSETESVISQQTMRVVIFSLNSSMSQDDSSIHQAALRCVHSLGLYKSSRHMACRILFKALSRSFMDLQTKSFPELEEDECLNEKNLLFSPPREKSREETILFRTPRECSSALHLISGFTRGSYEMKSICLEEIIDYTKVLSNEKVLEHAYSSRGTSIALLDACYAIISDHPFKWSVGSENEGGDIIMNILLTSVYLLGCPKEFDLKHSTTVLMEDLSCSINGIRGTHDLLHAHFIDIFLHIMKAIKEISVVTLLENKAKSYMDIFAFDALIRESRCDTVGMYFGQVGPTFVEFLKESSGSKPSNYKWKLFMMALLESIVSSDKFDMKYVEPFTDVLIESIIVPNLVWKVGVHASMLRKISIAVLFSIIHGDGLTITTLHKTVPLMIPVLKSNLNDDDQSTRQLVIASLGRIFESIPNTLGNEAVNTLYPDIIKCMDDSSDHVRRSSCFALKTFLKSAPPSHFRGTAIEYIVENLFIHMDDPDPTYKEQVYEVVQAAYDIDPACVIQNAQSSIMSHKTRKYCDLILIYASENRIQS